MFHYKGESQIYILVLKERLINKSIKKIRILFRITLLFSQSSSCITQISIELKCVESGVF